MIPSRRTILPAGLFALLATPVAQGQQTGASARLDGFDQWVQSVMAEWHAPGVCVGAVKDGRVVLTRGYGWRDVETKAPVTPRTVMAIASNTKSFTAVLMGMLVDERKLEWERPVRSYLPDFQLADPLASREMTPKDLVTHRSGLPRHDNLWYGRPFTRAELYHRLRYLEPTASFRSRYQYSNLMFVTAGYLIERVTGQGWDDLIRDRIFAPLGMTRSSTSVTQIAADDFAYPYIWRGTALERLPFRNIDAVAPAGGINSSLDDMLRYVQFRIDQGLVGDRRLLSAENETLMQSPQMVVGGSPQYPELGYDSYGLGLHVDTYRGRKNLGHGGQIDGFVSAMNWLPAERIGVVVLVNEGDNPVPAMVVRTLYDRLLGVEPVDWAARQRKADTEARARREKDRQALVATRRPGTSPSHPLSAYEGVYTNPAYGELTIKVDGASLTLGLAPRRARLEHFHYDVWEVVDPGETVPFRGLLRFETDLAGEVARVYAPAEPTLSGIRFEKRK